MQTHNAKTHTRACTHKDIEKRLYVCLILSEKVSLKTKFEGKEKDLKEEHIKNKNKVRYVGR